MILEGGLGKRARVAVLDQIEQTSLDEPLVVVATGQYLGEGFDCPQLDTLFLAFPVSFKGRLVQYTGRLMRAHEHKADVRVYDYADVRLPHPARDAHAPPHHLQEPRIHARAPSRALGAAHRSYTGCMTVTIDLPEDALARLEAEAKRRGVSIDSVIAELAEALPAQSSGPQTFSFVGLGSSTSGRYARDTDELLADGFGRD